MLLTKLLIWELISAMTDDRGVASSGCAEPETGIGCRTVELRTLLGFEEPVVEMTFLKGCVVTAS